MLKYKDKIFNEENSVFTDPALFSVFDFDLIQGDSAKLFSNDHSLILTETTAKRYFGNENPIGKVIKANDRTYFTVSGIVKDFPKNSSIQGDMFLPITLLFQNMYGRRKDGVSQDSNFQQFEYNTYLVLRPGSVIDNLTTKLRQIHLRNKPDDTDIAYLLQPLSQMHLYHADGTNGGIETVRMFMIIALLILVIACINYVNLSTARSMLRSKEVSMRKIVGAGKRQLFTQFLVETAMLFSFSALLSIALMYSIMPVSISFQVRNWCWILRIFISGRSLGSQLPEPWSPPASIPQYYYLHLIH